jgi:hypothetical protein
VADPLSFNIGDKVRFYMATRWGRGIDRTGTITDIRDGGAVRGGGLRYIVTEKFDDGEENEVSLRAKNILAVIKAKA